MHNRLFDSRRIIAVIGMALALLIFFSIVTYVATGRGISVLSGGGSILFTTTPTPSPVPCMKPHHASGDSTITITSGGIKRTSLLHLPQGYGQYIQPLVVGYHGYSW